MNTASQERLKLVFPKLATKIYQLSILLAAEELFITVAQGLRTVEEQDALYAKGRDAAGNVVDKAKVVTNARGGNSWHNFGLAVDCYPVDQAGGVDWNPQHPDWKRMEALGVSLGLTSGANWIRIVDAPHFQLTGRFPCRSANRRSTRTLQDWRIAGRVDSSGSEFTGRSRRCQRMNPDLQSIATAAQSTLTSVSAVEQAIEGKDSQIASLTQQNGVLQSQLALVKADDQSLAAQLLKAQQQLAAASWDTLRGVTSIGNLHMLPAKTTDNIEVPGVWIDSGGHTGQSNPGTNKTPHGAFQWTQGTFTAPGRIFFTPGGGWDNAFIYEHFAYTLPTLVRQRRIFSMLATDAVQENCVEWQDEWISKSLACKFNLGWQWNRSAKIFRYFDQNAQTWRTSPVPYVELGTSPIEVIGEFIIDPVAKTTTHVALTVAGKRTLVNVTQPATPAPGANDKYTISLIQLDSLGLGKAFGCNIHQCETLYL